MRLLPKMMMVLVGTSLIISHIALAQEAPAPRRSPRTPVSRQTLTGSKATLPPSRIIEGSATIIDTERLRIGDVEIRLFGVVPPQLSASYGPQARGVLDNLSMGVTVTCTIRDRDRSGWFLATCKGANNADFALELLRRGLAVTARGSLRPTELAAPYEAAEQAAQTQKIGLWSVTLPPAASDASIREAKARNEVVSGTANPSPALKTEAKTEVKNEIAPKEEKNEIAPKLQPPLLEERRALPVAIQTSPFEDKQSYAQPEPSSVVERYQLLITGLVMLLTAVGIVSALVLQRLADRREELRSIAAALRGELMAARAVCWARLNTLSDEADERCVAWPRIRTLVFQAYVGRLGLLGAELARQIASIYGQASDYAVYYNTSKMPETKAVPVSKRQALLTLVRHIEEVLPRLANLERRHSKVVTQPLLPQVREKRKENIVDEKQADKPLPASISPAASAAEILKAAPAASASMEEEKTVSKESTKTAKTTPIMAENTPESKVESGSTIQIGPFIAKATPLWNTLRKLATHKLERSSYQSIEDQIPDYASMTEEEIEALAYGALGEDESSETITGKISGAG